MRDSFSKPRVSYEGALKHTEGSHKAIMVTPERWERIKALFNSALAQPAGERAGFLKRACSDDNSIREEVESLLSANSEDDDFLDVPAHQMAAEMLDQSSRQPRVELAPGDIIGRYTILSSLGFGGMGEVYLAQDSELGRQIALKLLAPEFATDEHRVRRFEQEARAASALNHPNVCVIHEVGKASDGRHFMVMEYVDGTTLRRRMRRNRLTLQEALDVAAQIAWALEAAHAAGIVHRDIKPENVMLRRDGYVKVLDFGIAKLGAHAPLATDLNEASTVTPMYTAPGTLLGTVKYMSPEQLREQPIDARTDIWSLGVMLHEMVTGVTPFEAATPNDTIAIILEKHPTRLDLFSAEVPQAVRQVIAKTLCKKRSERYSSMSEVSAELRRLRRQISLDPSTDLLRQPTRSLESAGKTAQPGETLAGAPTVFSKLRSQAVSTADYLFSEIREHKKAAVFTGVTAIFALLLIGFKSPAFFRRSQPNAVLPTLKIAPLTNAGKSVCAAVSPEGRDVAHAEETDGMQELRVTRIANGATSIVVPRSEVSYQGLTFSPDGDYLYFTRNEKNETGALYQLALPGGAPRKIKSGVDSPVSFSPDGDRLAFVRFNRAGNEYSLLVSGRDGTGERLIATRKNGDKFSLYGPAWSPDSKSVVCGAGWWDHGYHMNLTEVDVESGSERGVGGTPWFFVFQIAWLQDKRELIVSAKEQPMSPIQLWRVTYPGGERVRITNDTSEYSTVSLSRDGKTIATIQGQQHAQLWIGSDPQRSRSIKSTVGRSYGLSWLNKGRLVFSSMDRSHLDIWSINSDGSGLTQLTSNAGDNYTPASSPDGRFIVFTSNRTGGFNIWRMNAEDGGEPTQLTFGDSDSYPSFSADGQWVLYDNQSSSTFNAWRVSINGGSPAKLTDQYSRMPIASPDGQFIAARYDVDGERGIAILSFDGGAILKKLPIPIMDWQRVQWLSNGRALAYMDRAEGASNIWSYELDSGLTKQLTDFKTDRIFAYEWSSDFEELACVRGTQVRDVTIINIANQ